MINTEIPTLTDTEKKAILDSAEEMTRGLYRFCGTWDMEPCSEAIRNQPIRWDVCYHGDPEWSYMFTRMDYLYILALATKLTGKNMYVLHGLEIINHWKKSHWIIWPRILKWGGVISIRHRSSHAHRTLDMAIMAANVTDYAIWCHKNGYINQQAFVRYRKMLHKLLAYLTDKLWDQSKLMSNWGILESGNIIYCHVQLYNHAPDYLYNELLRMVEHQIEGDGSNIESSPMYLVQVLLVLLKLLKNPMCDHQKELAQATLQGVKYISNIRKLNNCIPNIGDSDEIPIDDIMILAAEILGRKELQQIANRQLGLEFAVKYGIDRKQEAITHSRPLSEIAKTRYQTVYRGQSSYLLCSNHPAMWPAHKHYDYLSVLWSEFGKDVLIDMGRFTYRNCDERRFLKGPAAHNTISIVDSPFYHYIDSWRVRLQVTCYENIIIGEGHEWIAVKMHQMLGYDEIDIYRYVIYVFRKGLIVTDIISHNGEDSYRYETFFNISNDFSVVANEKGLTLNDTSGHRLHYKNDGEEPSIVSIVDGSIRYNERLKAKQIRVETVKQQLTHSFLRPEMGIVIPKYKDNTILYMFPYTGLSIEINK